MAIFNSYVKLPEGTYVLIQYRYTGLYRYTVYIYTVYTL